MPTLALAGASGVQLVYMAAALLFILGIKRLAGVRTARSGNALAAAAMLLAVGATLVLLFGDVALWILGAGVGVGAVIGFLLATRVPMTAMPELVAFFNGMGGAASMFVALSEMDKYRSAAATADHALSDGSVPGGGFSFAIAVAISILIGSLTLSGSLVAYGKLAGKINKDRIGPLGQNAVNIGLAAVSLVLLGLAVFQVSSSTGILLIFFGLALVAFVLGIGLVVGIGGADMPVVISLLNSYSGLAAAATGFVLQNNLLVIAGSLVGAAGLILTRIMCKAMNRSLSNVLFGGYDTAGATAEDSGYTTVKSTSAEEVAPLLDRVERFLRLEGRGRLRPGLPVRAAVMQVVSAVLLRSAAGGLREALWGRGDHAVELARGLFLDGAAGEAGA